MKQKLATGVAHKIPADLRQVLTKSPQLIEKWNDLTPLGRDEWICWAISVKKPETRLKHVDRLKSDVLKGKRRPCCWPGCPHR